MVFSKYQNDLILFLSLIMVLFLNSYSIMIDSFDFETFFFLLSIKVFVLLRFFTNIKIFSTFYLENITFSNIIIFFINLDFIIL